MSELQANVTPLTLLDAAIAKGIDADSLGKMLDLQQRWQADEARKQYFAAMQECQSQLPTVVKDAENKQTNSRYARLETLSRAIDPVIHEYGFAISYGSEDSPLERHIRIVATVMHRSGHQCAHRIDLPVDDEGLKGNRNKTGTHATGSTISYARRYLKLMAFDVAVAKEDDDGNRVPVIDGLQRQLLQRLMAEREINEGKFWEWAGVARLEDLPLDKFSSAKDMLLTKPIAKPRKEPQDAPVSV